MDGHLPRIPDFRLFHDDVDACELRLDDCFGSEFLQGEDVKAEDMFKRVAFDRFQCGDCCECLPMRVAGPWTQRIAQLQ